MALLVVMLLSVMLLFFCVVMLLFGVVVGVDVVVIWLWLRRCGCCFRDSGYAVSVMLMVRLMLLSLLFILRWYNVSFVLSLVFIDNNTDIIHTKNITVANIIPTPPITTTIPTM